MKRLIFFAFLLFSTRDFYAQFASDAIRYSKLQPGGPARFIGVSGSLGAVGADFGTLSTNPAGLALFRTNEFVLTPGLSFANNESTLRGSGNLATGDDKSNFNFNNIGIVFNSEPNGSRWKSFNVGIGYNKLANFHGTAYYEGKSKGSLVNKFHADAAPVLNGGGETSDLDPYGSQLAFKGDAFIYDTSTLLWSSDFTGNEQAVVSRNQALLTSGGINEMTIAFAGNYDEKLMVGATVGVPFVKYIQEATYNESDPDDNVAAFEKLRFTEYLRTNGVGVNLKMGVIYKFTEVFRLGAAFHTPTLMSLTDDFNNSFNYVYSLGGTTYDNGTHQSPSEPIDYKLRTPWRAMLSGAVVSRQFGFFNVDLEWVDYSANKFNLTTTINTPANQAYERDLNDEVRRIYKTAMNARIGAMALLDNFRLRGGLSFTGNPNEGKNNFDTGFSLGVGVRGEHFYLDMSYRRQSAKGSIQPYSDPYLADANDQPIADFETKTSDIVVTLGFKF